MIEEDPNYIYSPNSDLDSEIENERVYVMNDGEEQGICPNDWLDIDASVLPPDPLWGYSFQVYDLMEEEIVIKLFDPITEKYTISNISPQSILNVYRRVPRS